MIKPQKRPIKINKTWYLYCDAISWIVLVGKLCWISFFHSLIPQIPVSCSGLNKSWTNIRTETSFPVPPGTKVTVACERGYTHSGDSTVTCLKDTEFQHSSAPICTLGWSLSTWFLSIVWFMLSSSCIVKIWNFSIVNKNPNQYCQSGLYFDIFYTCTYKFIERQKLAYT